MMRKSQPFTLRLSSSLDALVTEEARRTRRSKGAIIEALAEEALCCRLFPGIAFRGTDWERRPWVIGTSLDVWEIIRAYQDFDSIERMLQDTDLTAPQLRLALAYYERFPDEINAALEESRRALDTLRADFPTIDVIAAAP
jgi:uncharacterized protein (DUF433 family)